MDKGDIEVWGHSSFTATGRGMMVTISRLLTFISTVTWFHCQFGIIWVAVSTLQCIYFLCAIFGCFNWTTSQFVEIQLGLIRQDLCEGNNRRRNPIVGSEDNMCGVWTVLVTVQKFMFQSSVIWCRICLYRCIGCSVLCRLKLHRTACIEAFGPDILIYIYI